jgi:putative PIN family toxin of toxin-antitoxin system
LTPVVFDTGVVVSALLFSSGPAGALRAVWPSAAVEPLISRPTLDELLRVLAYPKFGLAADEIELLLADYLPFTRSVQLPRNRPRGLPRCRDRDDDKFLRLAAAGKAIALVTGDQDLLALAGRTPFAITTVAGFLARDRG